MKNATVTQWLMFAVIAVVVGSLIGKWSLTPSGTPDGSGVKPNESRHLAMTEGELIVVKVEQQGLDVAAELFAPDGASIIRVDSPIGRWGTEVLIAVTETTGEHRLEIQFPESEVPRFQAQRATYPGSQATICRPLGLRVWGRSILGFTPQATIAQPPAATNARIHTNTAERCTFDGEEASIV